MAERETQRHDGKKSERKMSRRIERGNWNNGGTCVKPYLNEMFCWFRNIDASTV